MKSKHDEIETERLRIFPIPPPLMQKLLAGMPQLEAALELAPSGLKLDEHTHEAMAFLAGLAQETPWITNRLISTDPGERSVHHLLEKQGMMRRSLIDERVNCAT